jgi:hypothetical protein
MPLFVEGGENLVSTGSASTVLCSTAEWRPLRTAFQDDIMGKPEPRRTP